MKEKRIQKWESTRQKGKLRFIILYGVVGWGFGMAIIVPAIRSILFGTQIDMPQLLSGIVVFPIIGSIFGLVLWHISEIEYHNHQRKNKDHQLELQWCIQKEKL
ncbi:MAG: hypothetical protein ACLFP9_05960 [Desulfonatronovibrio sp.]